MKAFDHDLISVIVFDILGYTESRAGPWEKHIFQSGELRLPTFSLAIE